MSRITLSLPEELEDLLRREAGRRRTSVSKIARHAIEAYLDPAGPARTRVPFAGIGHSGHRHTARDAEAILATDWARDRDDAGGR